MSVGNPLDIALMFQGIEAVHGGLVRGDLAPKLDLTDKGGIVMLCKESLDEIEYRVLLYSKR